MDTANTNPTERKVMTSTRNNEIPTGKGNIDDVNRLIAMWFPGERMTAVQTSSPEESSDGYLKFNLLVSYGEGIGMVQYMKSQTYRDFCEGEIGRDLGHIEQAHHLRCELRALLKTEAFQRSTGPRIVLDRMVKGLAGMGWSVVKDWSL